MQIQNIQKHTYELTKQRIIPGLLGGLQEIRGEKHIELDIIISLFLGRICELSKKMIRVLTSECWG